MHAARGGPSEHPDRQSLGQNAKLQSGSLQPMKTIKTFPRKVRETPNTFIPLPDGTQLAARIWMPPTPTRNRYRSSWNTCPTASATAPMCAMR
jgi:predicted acyl esterase